MLAHHKHIMCLDFRARDKSMRADRDGREHRNEGTYLAFNKSEAGAGKVIDNVWHPLIARDKKAPTSPPVGVCWHPTKDDFAYDEILDAASQP